MRAFCRVRLAAPILFAVLFAAPAPAAQKEIERTGGPYVPTPQVVVDQMLRIGRIGPRDFVVDLGSGDGVIVLTAVEQLKAQGFGVDIDPDLVALANGEAKKRGVADRARFYVQDVFKADISNATVVTFYLLPQMMLSLRSKVLSELKPGTRVVSHDYHFDDWTPDDQYTWDVPEKEKITGVPRATVYLWIVPARIAGTWQVKVEAPAAEAFDLTLKQRYQDIVDGVAVGSGIKERKLSQSLLSGDEISFAFLAGSDRQQFKGRVSGDTMEGTMVHAGKKISAKWTATRVKTQS